MKIIIFGVGNFYKNRKKEIASHPDIEIVAFADNDRTLWGNRIDNVPIISPDEIYCLIYDQILIMSLYAWEIYEQLIANGIEKSKIQFWEPFYAKMNSGKRQFLPGRCAEVSSGARILIISTSLKYNGGSLAAVYAALAMKKRGYSAVLAVPDGDGALIEETRDAGVSIVVCPSLPYIYAENEEWLKEFDWILVNVFQMFQSACAGSLIRPTLWWIHESTEVYSKVMSKPWNHIERNKLTDVGIYAVSNLAKENFNKLFAGRIKETLCYGIPDAAPVELAAQKNKSKVIFALIGNICEGKAQDIFIEAIYRLKYKEQAEFWIIGACPNNTFGRMIIEKSHDISSIKIMGLLTRKEIYDVFSEIDVVVCASREDSLPIVMTEGMMFRKVCIATDRTGTADYIKDGENGFVIPGEDADALKEKMEWIIGNRDKLRPIGINARKTYEKYFTMDVFGESLERALMETSKNWKAAEK